MNFFRNRLNRVWQFFPADYLRELEPDTLEDWIERELSYVLKRWDLIRAESTVPRAEFPTADQLEAETDNGRIVPRSAWLNIPPDNPRLDAFVIDRHTLLGMGSLRQVLTFSDLPAGCAARR
jgi:hypothetical protein